MNASDPIRSFEHAHGHLTKLALGDSARDVHAP
jgi:hypothetical protein